jgi:hypothetical protein
MSSTCSTYHTKYRTVRKPPSTEDRNRDSRHNRKDKDLEKQVLVCEQELTAVSNGELYAFGDVTSGILIHG